MRQERQPSSNRSQFQPMAPHGNYPCQGDNNWIAISCRDDQDFKHLCALIDAAWTDDFMELEARLAMQDELDLALSAWTAQFDKFTSRIVCEISPSPPLLCRSLKNESMRIPQLRTSTFGQPLNIQQWVKFASTVNPYICRNQIGRSKKVRPVSANIHGMYCLGSWVIQTTKSKNFTNRKYCDCLKPHSRC